MFPPSPAVSVCDSLDGIDDLDAFLDSQGRLSHFPTPPLKKQPLVTTVELLDASDVDHESIDDFHIATHFVDELSSAYETTSSYYDIVAGILLRAGLPVEVLAMAFNIVASVGARHLLRDRLHDLPTDLLIVSALNLAVTYTDDHPPRSSWWSRHVCDATWTARRIDKATLKLLSLLDFQLHEFTDRIDDTIARLLDQEAPLTEEGQWQDQRSSPELSAKQPLKLLTAGSFTRWAHGQVTPDDTPPCTALQQCRLPLGRFLPLL